MAEMTEGEIIIRIGTVPDDEPVIGDDRNARFMRLF
jgi:hypothetical protein